MSKLNDQIKCLQSAISIIERDPNLNVELARTTADSLRMTLNRLNTTALHRKEEAYQRILVRMGDTVRDIYVAAVAKAADERAINALGSVLDQLPVEDRARYLRNLLEFEADFTAKRDRPHVAGLIRAETSAAVGALRELWDAITDGTTTGWIRTSDFAVEFMRAARGVADVSPEAKRLADLYHAATRPFLARLRKAGVWVEVLDDYLPQTHSMAKIVADRRAWETFLRENLDPTKHPDVDATIDRIFTTLATRDVGEKETQRVLTTSRKIFFRSPEAEHEYNLRFGDDNFAENLFASVQTLARKAVLAEQLGPSAAGNVHTLLKKITEDLAVRVQNVPEHALRLLADAFDISIDAARKLDLPAELKKAEPGSDRYTAIMNAIQAAEVTSKAQKALTDRRLSLTLSDVNAAAALADSLAGEFSTPHNQTLANWMAASRNLMAASKLGLTTLAQLVQDMPIGFFASRFHAGGFAKGVVRNISAIKAILGDDGARRWAEDMGIFTHALFASRTSRMATALDAIEQNTGQGTGTLSGQARQFTQRLSGMTQRLSLSHQTDRVLRSAFMLMASRRMMELAKSKAWTDLPSQYRAVVLENNGWTESAWREFQKTARARPGVGGLEPASLTPELRALAMSTLYREADLAIVFPGHYDRLLLSLYQKPGTFGGELVAQATQFLSWPVAFVRGPMAREWQVGGAGKIGFAAGMIASGVLTVQLYAIAKNEPAFEWDSPELWMRGIARSGLLTPLGETVLQFRRDSGSGIVEGPVASELASTIGSMFNASRKLYEGEEDRAAAVLLRQVKSTFVPNIWWAEFAALSRGMDYAMETLDPEYVRSRQARFRREGRME